MARFEQLEWIARTPDDVFRFITDSGNAPRLMASVKRMEKLSDGPVSVGTRYRETRVMNGKEAQAELEVVTYEPPHLYSMRNVTEGFETTYHYTFKPEGEGTRVHLAGEVKAGGLKKMMIPVVVAALKKEDGDHLARLKAAVEAR
jgi:carbon monoxide dehydrogenase subunit G